MPIGLMMALAVSANRIPAVGPNAQTYEFLVGNRAFSFPIPAGYCKLSGATANLPAQLVTTDTRNHLVAVLVRCGWKSSNGAPDYTVIKTPVGLEYSDVPREMIFQKFGSGQPQVDMKTIDDNWSRVLHEKIETSHTIKRIGHDDVCAYDAGIASIIGDGSSTEPKIAYDQGAAACFTSIRGAALTISRFGKPTDVLQLIREAKYLASSISFSSAGR